MSLLAPLALLLGLLAAPIIVLYMLRLRRVETPVSSTLLWEKLLRDRQANAPWQRLRRNLLLLLQLLILAALAFALARPFLPTPSIVSGNVVVLLDGSASMMATDVQPSRFEAARAEVARWIGELGGDEAMTLILAGSRPTVLSPAGADPQALREALAQAQPASVVADWPAALALARGAAQGFEDARIVVVSDGGLPDDLPAAPAEVIYVPIGTASANLALSALATRSGAQGVQLLASVTNHSVLEQETLVSLYVDDALFDARRVTLARGEQRNLTWELPESAQMVRAELSEQTEDHLALDDRAWAVNAGGAGARALLVTPGNLFLEQVLGLLPGLTTFRAAPDAPLPGTETDDEEAGEGQPYELLVLDSIPLPDPLPPGDLLLVNPSSGAELFTAGAVFSDTAVTRLADSPLLQFIEWRGVNVREARSVSAPWAQPVIEAAGGPLLLAGETGGRRVVIIPFDLHDSDLPLRIAFPVLMANITSWLSPGQVLAFGGSLAPGQPAALSPAAGASAMLVDKPDGERRILSVDEEQRILFEETDQLGLYAVTAREEGGDRLAGRFAVNLFAPQESGIAPAATLSIGQRSEDAAQSGDVGRRELWPWLAALALLILIVEWWVHFQGARLPDRRQLTTDDRPLTAVRRLRSAVRRLFLFFTFVLLASCAPAPEFDAINPGGEAPGAMARRPAAVSFVELDANPLLYRNTFVRVTGAYAPPPEPPCTPYKGPPASWSLVDSGLRLDVQGFSEVMELMGEGSQVTVDGFWERYKGPVGCGKEPPTQTLWYLRAVQLVQPNPLPELAGLPGDASATEEEGAPTPDLEATPVLTSTPTPQATDDATTTPTPTSRFTATPSPTPDLTASPTATLEPDVTPSATPTPTTDDETTPEAGGTGEPGATPTPTPGGSDPPGATDTPPDYPPPDATPTPDPYG